MFIRLDKPTIVKNTLDILVINADIKNSYDVWHVETMLRDVVHREPFIKHNPRKAAVAIFLSYFFIVEKTDPDYDKVFSAFYRAVFRRNDEHYARYEAYCKIRDELEGKQFTYVLSICRKVLGLSANYDSIWFTFFIDCWLWVKNHRV